MGNILTILLPLLSNPEVQKLLPLIMQMGTALFPNVPAAQVPAAVASALDVERTKWVQGFLKSKGSAIEVDGSYGTKTKDAVAKWQAAHGLTADGWAGSDTGNAMRSELFGTKA